MSATSWKWARAKVLRPTKGDEHVARRVPVPSGNLSTVAAASPLASPKAVHRYAVSIVKAVMSPCLSAGRLHAMQTLSTDTDMP